MPLFWRAQADAESRLRMSPAAAQQQCCSSIASPARVSAMDDAALERLRGGVAAMIFQEPMLALDIYANLGHRGEGVGCQLSAGMAGIDLIHGHHRGWSRASPLRHQRPFYGLCGGDSPRSSSP